MLQIAGEEGWHALTMRKIAQRICYSPPMIYEVFASKEAIWSELVNDGFQRLYRHLSTAGAGLAEPRKRLWALLFAYRRFAWENQAYYQAMFGLAPLAVNRSQPDEHVTACLSLLGDALLQCLGDRCPLKPLQAAKAISAAAHGVIAYHLAGLLPDRTEAESMYEQVLVGLLSGWGVTS